MVVTVIFFSISSFIVINLNKSPHQMGFTIFWQERCHLGWCQICLTPIETRRIDISSSKGRIRYVGLRNGIACPIILITPGRL